LIKLADPFPKQAKDFDLDIIEAFDEIVDVTVDRYRGASTIRVKFQIAAIKGPKLVVLYSCLHVDFRSGSGTPFQGVRRVLSLPRDP
jgi:hypothetical protein